MEQLVFNFFGNIIANEKTLTVGMSKFSHCSSVCEFSAGSLIAWYSGTYECSDDQSVYLTFIGKQTSDIIRIGDKTGNPVLWNVNNNHAILLYSKFEGIGTIGRLIDKWKYCSLWVQNIHFDNGIQLIGDPVELSSPHQHLLGRCKPIVFDNRLLIPLYNEVDGYNVIAEFADNKLNIISKFGEQMIQPTLWINNGKLCSLSRNFKSTKDTAQYCESDDGITWTKPLNSGIVNNNSSIHAINFDNHIYVLWNNTRGKYRCMLTLGEILPDQDGSVIAHAIKIIKADHGSYPSIAKCSQQTSNVIY